MPVPRRRSRASFGCVRAAVPSSIAIAAAAAVLLAGGNAQARVSERTTVGASANGAPIELLRVGARDARRTVMVVGEIHGTELAGRAVTRRLRSVRPPRGTALLLVDDPNPDGAAMGTRQNARGVDLNRNFPFGWRPIGAPFDTYYSGPEAALGAGVQRPGRAGPARSPARYRLVPPAPAPRRPRGRRPFLQRLYCAPLRAAVPRHPHAARDCDELAEPHLSTRHGIRGRAARRGAGPPLARSSCGVGPDARPSDRPAARRPPPRSRSVCSASAQMRAYARRHYGIDDYRLRRPTRDRPALHDANSFRSAFDTLRRKPARRRAPRAAGRLRPLRDRPRRHYPPARAAQIMCRHTVGLNWTAIGIEHVGTSDGAGARQPPPARAPRCG